MIIPNNIDLRLVASSKSKSCQLRSSKERDDVREQSRSEAIAEKEDEEILEVIPLIRNTSEDDDGDDTDDEDDDEIENSVCRPEGNAPYAWISSAKATKLSFSGTETYHYCSEAGGHCEGVQA